MRRSITVFSSLSTAPLVFSLNGGVADNGRLP